LAEAWFDSPVQAVRDAMAVAMARAGIAIEGDDAELVGVKQQVPHVGRGAGEPAPGPLPVYRIRVTFARDGGTRVRARLEPVCPACNGKTPYVWQYPGDLLRDVFEETRQALGEREARFSYPARHKPVRWRPPKRP
jgi:hypothetical protein